MKKCPFCSEDINENAIKCKHCGEFLTKIDVKKIKMNRIMSRHFIIGLIGNIFLLLSGFLPLFENKISGFKYNYSIINFWEPDIINRIITPQIKIINYEHFRIFLVIFVLLSFVLLFFKHYEFLLFNTLGILIFYLLLLNDFKDYIISWGNSFIIFSLLCFFLSFVDNLIYRFKIYREKS